MKNKRWYLILFSGLTLACAILFNTKIGDIPSLGKFLNPFTGFWQNAENRNPENESLQLEGLTGKVSILIDSNAIPHIFAQYEEDLYFAQGYITAKDRLWQMDFQTRYAAGRLSEVVGEKALELDRYQRRMGMVHGAEAMLLTSMQDPKSKLLIEAYAKGINAYIRQLSPRDYPIEFKLLNYAPEEWQPMNSALLLKLMSATLARGTNELALSNILDTYGQEVVDDLFPNYPFRTDPIIPQGTEWEFSAESEKEVPSIHSPVIVQSVPSKSSYRGFNTMNLLTSAKPENIGSNNWAVDGRKSATGFPMLANDPHLDLTLPSIWYQVQLHGPEINVYGASIPGAPSVIIGFNSSVAWGITNVGSDVLDWYRVQFKDEKKMEYLYNDEWRKTRVRIEEIKIKGMQSVFDTVYYTHQGPVSYPENSKPIDFPTVNNVPEGYALSWVAHLPSNELRTFYELNKAKDYEDYRNALNYYTAPAQNFVFADHHGDISITSNGLFPLKEHRQGKFLLDGTTSIDESKQRIPAAHNPTVKNPERGFVSSANQAPVDQSYPYYLGWEFAPYERAHRINNILTESRKVTLKDFIRLQNDNYSVLAKEILPILLQALEPGSPLSQKESEALKLLKAWDLRYEPGAVAPTIFESWYHTLDRYIWSDNFKNDNVLMRSPGRDRTVQLLLHQSESPWYAVSGKPNNRDELVRAAFRETIKQLNEKHGNPNNWQWAKVRKAHVPHLAAIPGLGSAPLWVGGTTHTVNAMGEKNGPSWRMIVQLGEKPKAYGIIPGGQSGNPGSKFYDNQLSVWKKGELNELLFFRNRQDYPDKIIKTMELISAN